MAFQLFWHEDFPSGTLQARSIVSLHGLLVLIISGLRKVDIMQAQPQVTKMVSLRPFSSLHAVKAPAQDLPHRVHGATFCSRGKFVEDLGKIMVKATAAEV